LRRNIADICRNCGVRNGVGHFERKCLGKGGRLPTTVGVGKLESLGLRDPTFSCFDTIPACDRQRQTETDRQTHRHTTTANTRAWLAPRGLKIC